MLEMENVSSVLWCIYFSLRACMDSKQWGFVGLELRCAGCLLCVGMQKNCLYLKHQFGFSLFGFDCGFPCLLFLSWKLLRLASKTSTKMTNGHLVWGVGGERTDRYCDLILFKCPKKLSLKKKINPKSTLESTLRLPLNRRNAKDVTWKIFIKGASCSRLSQSLSALSLCSRHIACCLLTLQFYFTK